MGVYINKAEVYYEISKDQLAKARAKYSDFDDVIEESDFSMKIDSDGNAVLDTFAMSTEWKWGSWVEKGLEYIHEFANEGGWSDWSTDDGEDFNYSVTSEGVIQIDERGELLRLIDVFEEMLDKHPEEAAGWVNDSSYYIRRAAKKRLS